MSDLINLSIAEAQEQLRKKNISAVELTEAYLAEIEAANKSLNAYVHLTPELALDMAKKSDQRLSSGEFLPLDGIALGIKDVFATKNIHTQCCSNMLKDFKPPYESTVTQKLWQNGAVMLGKLNMDEFAMGSSNESSCYGPAVNPWRASDSDELLVSGGSSGGSSCAVAARLCAAAMATDTGGSIRQPAAFTATVGIKPTYGRCSRWGLFAFASSLDQAGVITRDLRDAAIMMKIISGFDAKDSTSANIEVPDYEAFLGKSIKGKKIGVPLEYRHSSMSEEILQLWDKGIEYLTEAGAEIIDVSLPYSKYALSVYYIIASAEAASNLARYDGVRYGLRVEANDINEMYEKSRSAGFGAEVQRRILLGTAMTSDAYYQKYFLKAQKIRRLIKQDFDNLFSEGIEAILTPTTPSLPFAIGREKAKEDVVQMYLNDMFTVNVNMAGLPAFSIPVALSNNNLPMSLQLIGRPFDEANLFQLCSVIEKSAGHFTAKKWW